MGIGQGLNTLFGSAPQYHRSTYFDRPGAKRLGKSYVDFLNDRLTGDITEDPRFRNMMAGLKDQASGSTAAMRERMGTAAVQNNFTDSGRMVELEAMAGRQEAAMLTEGANNIFQYLENSRTAEVLPFLSAAAQEYVGVGQGNVQARLQHSQQNLEMAQSIMEMFSGMSYCYVAAEIFGGWDAWETLLARLWMATDAPPKFRDWYYENGPKIAKEIRRDDERRSAWKKFFDGIVLRGRPGPYPPEYQE